MGCNCQENKRKSIEYIINMAYKYAQGMYEDVQIYKEKLPTGEAIYNFEPINPDRKNIVLYIDYRDFSHSEA